MILEKPKGRMTDLDLKILKVITENKKLAVEFASGCDEKIFLQDYWRFAKIVLQYINVYKEVPTERVLIEQNQNNDSLVKYIEDMFKTISVVHYNDKEFKHDLNVMKDRYAKRMMISLRDTVFSDDDMPIDKSIKEIQSFNERIKGLYKSKVYDQKTLKESLRSFHDTYKAKTIDPNFGRGVLTGYSFLDFQTNGLRPAELVLIAGESSSGKSTVLMNLAIQMWLQNNKLTTPKDKLKKGYNVLYFSLEMPHQQCLNRVISRLAEIPYRGIRDGKLLSKDEVKMGEALNFIKNYDAEFEIVDLPRGATAENIELIFNETKVKFNPDVIIVDYLGLMECEGDESDWQKLSKIAGQLHEIARVHNICVLSAVQLNRLPKTKDAVESIGLHRIARSAGIATHANIIIQIEQRPNEHLFPDMILHFIKNRDGANVKGTLRKNFSCCSLIDVVMEQERSVEESDDISESVKKFNEN